MKEVDFINISNFFNYYDFENLESLGEEIIIEVKKPVRYSEVNDSAEYDFKEQTTNIQKIILLLIQMELDNKVYIRKYEDYWVHKEFLKSEKWSEFKINNDFSGVYEIEELSEVKSLIEGNLKYESFVQFLIPNKQLIITPTDHMDIFCHSVNSSILLRNLERIFKTTNLGDYFIVKRKK